MKIAILGTRGIPNNYGGFEQLAEYLSVGLVKKGHEVTVYSPHHHPYKKNTYKGVVVKHCFDPEVKIGTVGQFIYDLNCILHLRKLKPHIVLQLGYTSSSIWSFLMNNQTVVTNMDGMEWKRSKYSNKVKWFLKHAERWAANQSAHLIADNEAIATYLHSKYNNNITTIAYGAEMAKEVDQEQLKLYGLYPQCYYMLLARFEPENNLSMILDGYVASRSTFPFLVVGNVGNAYGQLLQQRYANYSNVIFAGPIYSMPVLNALRQMAALYFHGHSVGGTNPSLLEAMACGAKLAVHNNGFNRSVVGDNALYFNNSQAITELINTPSQVSMQQIAANYELITHKYSWSNIINAYDTVFKKLIP